MNFNLFNSLILAGCIQGFVFSLVWLANKKYRAQNAYFLIALIVVYSLSNLQYYLLDIGVFDPVSFYDLYHIPLSLLMPALLLCYGLSILQKPICLKGRHFALFVPFIVVLLLSLYYKYQLVVTKKPSGYNTFLDQIPSWGEYIAMAYSFFVLGYLIYHTKKAREKTVFSLTKVKPELRWFKRLLIVQLFATLLWLLSEISFGDSYETMYYYPLWIILAIIIYWLGHVGIYKYGITKERAKIRDNHKQAFSITAMQTSKNELIVAFEDYIKVKQNYVNPSLTLDITARALGVSAGHLSKTINAELQQNFKDYVNKLRVAKAKHFLKHQDFSQYTLVAIGLEAGFNSKSAFNASFKKITGQTPSQYKLQHTN